MIKHAISNLANSFTLLEQKDKKWLALLIALSILNGIVQTVGVVSIMPFIALISDPEVANQSRYFQYLNTWLPTSRYEELLLVSALLSFSLLFISNALMVVSYSLNVHFFNKHGARLSSHLLSSYLHTTPYEFYQHSQSDLTKKISSDVDRALIGSQIACLSIITDIVIFLVILTILLVVNPSATIFTMLGISVGFILIYVLLSKKIEKLGVTFEQKERSVFSNLIQALNLYKEIKISGKQSHFINAFKIPNDLLYKNASKYHTLQFIPIQILELVVFGVILVLASYLALNNSPGNTITTISLYAFASYRLIPVYKSLFESLEEIIYTAPTLDTLLKDLNTLKVNNVEESDHKMVFNQTLEIKDLSFKYPTTQKNLIDNISFNINSGEITCISGPSGIGKSTFLDLLLGLHQPSSGTIFIDGIPLTHSNIVTWQSNIGYVPQNIQLLNNSIKENIAFGQPYENIDIEQVISCAKNAQIFDKVMSLKEGIDTKIGDGLLALSGGEKQRIAIARALYHKPQLLILDEATNELDLETESNVIQAIKALDCTVIIVSHKPSIVDCADSVIRISNKSWGKVT